MTGKRKRHNAARGRRARQDRVPEQPAGGTDPYRDLRTLSRLRLQMIWESAQLGMPLEDEEARTAQVMQEHPEYAGLWARLDTVSDAELEKDGVNPILHVMIHSTLENQLADNDPPATGEVLAALMARGLSRHEALHEMGGVLAGEIFDIMKSNRPFDQPGYERKLWGLVRE